MSVGRPSPGPPLRHAGLDERAARMPASGCQRGMRWPRFDGGARASVRAGEIPVGHGGPPGLCRRDFECTAHARHFRRKQPVPSTTSGDPDRAPGPPAA